MKKETCKICSNTKYIKYYNIPERLLNKGKTFSYYFCPYCQTLQYKTSIINISDYYKKNYYSFSEKTEFNYIKYLDYFFLKCLFFLKCNPDKYRIMQKFSSIKYLMPIQCKFNNRILDIGCGSGNTLKILRSLGFKDLTGVDLYSPEPKEHIGINYIKGDIFSIPNKKYDLILLNHSFEHMDNPLDVMKKLSCLLSEKGICIIRIPVIGKYAWRKYGISWFQLDVPRHLFIYSEKAISYMAKKCNMKVQKIIFDSNEAQFRISERYANTNWDLQTIQARTVCKIRINDKKKAELLNKIREGDQAAFYLQKQQAKRK